MTTAYFYDEKFFFFSESGNDKITLWYSIYSAQPLREPILSVVPPETNVSEYGIKILLFFFNTSKCIWKWRLQNNDHFVQASICEFFIYVLLCSLPSALSTAMSHEIGPYLCLRSLEFIGYMSLKLVSACHIPIRPCRQHGTHTRYVKLRVAGMPEMFIPPQASKETAS